jgi:transcriptional regulator
MYQPPHFREERLEVQHAFMRANPLAILVTMGPGGLAANPVPLVLEAGEGSHGVLRGHLARANPQWSSYDPSVECLTIFQGPDTYITPSWYETKHETGKVVPTWNYAIVQASGRLKVIDDPAWLRSHVEALTAEHESSREAPWAVTDAPDDFIAAQIMGIVGIEIAITRIEGKWKVSQNRRAADIEEVIEGLRADANPRRQAMADLVAARRTEK